MAYSNQDTSRKTNARRRVHCTGRTRQPEKSLISASCIFIAAVTVRAFVRPLSLLSPCFLESRAFVLPVVFHWQIRSRSHLQAHTRASSSLATAKKEYTTLSSALSAPAFDGTETHPLAPSTSRRLLNDIFFFLFLLLLVVSQHPPPALRG